MSLLFWSGPRESDIFYTGDMFAESVTFYGSNENGNCSFCAQNEIRINHNAYNEEASNFILEWQMKKIKEYPDCKFMSYNPNCIIGAPDEIVKHTICLNDAELMTQLNNKLEFREISKGIIPLLHVKTLYGKECKYAHLSKLKCFSNCNSFVIQELTASGGHGTFYLTAINEQDISKFIVEDSKYIVSGYIQNNIPINIHAVIYNQDIVLLPGSIQIIQMSDNRLLYRGADFITYRDIPKESIIKFKSLTLEFCKKIQKLGYRGVIGIDAMLVGNDIYFLEANNRFQGSSSVLNKALSEAGLPSLQRMNYDAFLSNGENIPQKNLIENLEVSYSSYTLINEMSGVHARHMYFAVQKENTVSEIIPEGFQLNQKAEDLASLFLVIFCTNLVSICDNTTCVRLHPNISTITASWNKEILKHNWTVIKTSLINRGAVLNREAKQYIETHGKMRDGTYFSLDIYVSGIYINCPLYVKMTRLSPFSIGVNRVTDKLCLIYYNTYLADIEYDLKKDFQVKRLKNGTPIDSICFLATDRLRLQNNSFCTFPKHGLECSFCEANGIFNTFGEKEILEAIDTVFQEELISFRHILIGGLSNDIGKEKDVIINMCKRIRQYTDMPIYLMCLPPSIEDIEAYYNAGVNEFGFNLEIYDRALAKKYMPGKGNIPLDRYMTAFAKAVDCTGNNGTVRCAFIVGLEPEESLLKGIEQVCKYGVAPILSVFRPIPGTKLENMIPPSDEWLYSILEKAESICKQYNLTLGPECPACRNNTLSFVKQGEVESLYALGWKRGTTEEIFYKS